jgi:hypothetical protein
MSERLLFGKETFAAGSTAMKGVKLDGASEIVEIKVLGDWAWKRNKLRVEVTPPGGKTIVKSGCTLTILRKEKGAGCWQGTRICSLDRQVTSHTFPSQAIPPRIFRALPLFIFLHKIPINRRNSSCVRNILRYTFPVPVTRQRNFSIRDSSDPYLNASRRSDLN